MMSANNQARQPAHEKLRPTNSSLPKIDAGFKKVKALNKKFGFANSLASNEAIKSFAASTQQSLEGISTNLDNSGSNFALTHRSTAASPTRLLNSVQKLNILDTHGNDC
jgi:hypothetical protein